jgi:hypothetical protein
MVNRLRQADVDARVDALLGHLLSVAGVIALAD